MRHAAQPDLWPMADFEDAIANVRAVGFEDPAAYASALANAIEWVLEPNGEAQRYAPPPRSRAIR